MTNAKIVNIISNLRIDSEYTSAYINQLLSLKQDCFKIGKIVLVCDKFSAENQISKWANIDSRVVLVDENKSDINTVTIEEKTQQWIQLCNQGIDKSMQYQSDYVLFVEADLTIPFDLLDELVLADLDICAPVIFLGGGFYDSWGFRELNGNKIRLIRDVDVFSKPVELSSVGSCVLFRTEIFSQNIRFRGPYDSGLLVGVCNDSREFGYRVWMLPHLSIIHPTSAWRKQMWWIKEIKFNHSLLNGNIDCNLMVAGAYHEFIEFEVKTYLESLKEVAVLKKILQLNYKISFVKNETSRSINVEIIFMADSSTECNTL